MLNHIQTWCGASALCDIIIAICMTYYVRSFYPSFIFIDVDTISQLMRQRSTTNFRRTRILVTKIIRLTIETGSATGIYFASSAVVRIMTPLTSSCCGFVQLCHFYRVPPSDFLHNSRPSPA